MPRATAVNVASPDARMRACAGCTMRPPTTQSACRSHPCRPTNRPATPAPPSSAPSDPSPATATSIRSWPASWRPRPTRWRRRWARSSSRIPDRPGLHLVAAIGMDEPAHRPARDRGRRPRSSRSPPRLRPARAPSTARARPPDGADLRRRLPAAGRVRGGVEVTLGSMGFGWPAPRVLDDAERATHRVAGRARGGRHRPCPAGFDRRRTVRMVRADGPHGPADRARQRAHGRPDPRARAGPGRAPGQRGLARHVRRRRLPDDQPRRRQRDR